MKKQKKDKDTVEIRVLDRGKNFDDPVVMHSWCCTAPWFPLYK
ncbi:MAG: hypothetical protein PVG39_16415 [Desulfobacteraceae bacterium]|jgi:hypothetical protein